MQVLKNLRYSSAWQGKEMDEYCLNGSEGYKHEHRITARVPEDDRWPDFSWTVKSNPNYRPVNNITYCDSCIAEINQENNEGKSELTKMMEAQKAQAKE